MQTIVTEEVVARPIRASARLRVYMVDLLSTVPYYTGTLCEALKNGDQVEVTIGCITYHLDPDFFNRRGLHTDPALFDVASRVSSLGATIRRGLKLIEYGVNLITLGLRLRFSKPAVIHVQFLPAVKFGLPIELWFLRIVRGLGIKIVYTVHNVLPQDTGRKYFDKYKWIYGQADRLICHSDSARERLVGEFGIDPAKISIIPHGPLLGSPSATSASEVRRSLGVTDEECLVLCQGILRPYKGIPFLLNAWARVESRGVRACLAIVGNGDTAMKRALREQVESLAIQGSVRLDFRFVPVDELAAYHEASDIIVYPYKEITTSGALMTGIAYGKAIVATRQPGFEQLLSDGHNALMVDYGDIDGLAKKIVQLTENPALRSRLGRQARQSCAQGPQWPEIAKQTIACYEAATCSN